MTKVLFSGSRNFSNKAVIQKIIRDNVPIGSTVIHGDCRGVDKTVDALCLRGYYSVIRYPAEWDKYGKRAGILRNNEMLLLNPDIIICIHEDIEKSKGTKHMMFRAIELNKILLVFDGQGNIIREVNNGKDKSPFG